ncbi:MAG: hypothetical protein WDN31_07395 [Hyphomicrobium sp.]
MVITRLRLHFLCRLVFAQPEISRVAQNPILRALGKGDLRDEARLDPADVAADRARHIDERACLARELCKARAELV